MRRQTMLLLTTMGVALMMCGGAALAATLQCESRVYCEGTAESDTLLGTDRIDRMYGLGGDDSLKGFDRNDSLFGSEGNDRLLGGRGIDDLVGGEGDDRLVAGGGDKAVPYGDFANFRFYGEWGHDIIIGRVVPESGGYWWNTGGDVDFYETQDDLTIDLNSDSGPLPEAKNASGTATIDWEPHAIQRVYGGDGDDTIIGDDAPNTIYGGGFGHDTISGGAERDWIDVQDFESNDADTVDCGPGRDEVWADPDDAVARNCERVDR